jgi:hypothetical protein
VVRVNLQVGGCCTGDLTARRRPLCGAGVHRAPGRGRRRARDQSAPCGLGALLLAGSEVLRLERAAAGPAVEPPDTRSQP